MVYSVYADIRFIQHLLFWCIARFQDNDGIYRPPKFMPTVMDEEDKRRKQDSRKDKAIARMAKENPYIKQMIDDAAGRPEEVCYPSISNLSCVQS